MLKQMQRLGAIYHPLSKVKLSKYTLLDIWPTYRKITDLHTTLHDQVQSAVALRDEVEEYNRHLGVRQTPSWHRCLLL